MHNFPGKNIFLADEKPPEGCPKVAQDLYAQFPWKTNAFLADEKKTEGCPKVAQDLYAQFSGEKSIFGRRKPPGGLPQGS